MTAVLSERTRVRNRRAEPAPKQPKQPKVPREPRAQRPVRAPRPGDETAIAFSTALTMLSIVCLWVAAQLLVLGGLSHDRDQSLLYGEFRTQVASATAPIGPVVPVGDPVATLTIARLGIDEVVVEGTASGDTLAGPGHLRNTVLPGQVGTAVVMGRATTYGGPFGALGELRAGDEIEVVMAQGAKTFTVLGLRRPGDPLPQPLVEGSARLTLVTAEGGGGRFASLAPDSVLYVDADATEGFPAPSGRPAAVPDSEKPLASDSGAVPLLALDLALLLALTLGVIAARQRWSSVLVWVIASPVAIALSWTTTDVVMRLLPNVI
ncbi:sortase [Nocardioides psychrotolerans]|uniref:Sortase A n=1 Tax=Nocardioides psychrotolerans TaxID=1005945 RepID=A0A1I3H390_9ACTN|nr:sortase [Nocardioides psychrotolerans]GEP37763.1 sortase [Nocardioides psychrotolerans]SFI30235.1 sortase A [Nocardioides psychrotolerans]